MHVKKLLTALILGLGLTLALVAGLELGLAPVERVRAQGSVYYVDDDACPATGSGTEGDPFCHIQDAVDAAGDDDEVRVAAGTYTGTQLVVDSRTGYTYTQVVFITESLRLRGGYDAGDWSADPDPTANPTVIDAERSGRGVSIVGTSGDEPAVTMDGFTITGGDYTGLGNPAGVNDRVCQGMGDDCGGGLFAHRSGLILRNSVITDNIASSDDGDGGGIYLWHVAAPGVHLANTTVVSNSIQGHGSQGGGLFQEGDASGLVTITQSVFCENSAAYYGGMYLYRVGTLNIVETDFVNNTAYSGQTGGVHLNGFGNLSMDRVRFQDNQASRDYAGLYLYGVGSSSRARLTNVLFSGNGLTSTTDDDSVLAIFNYATRMEVELAHVTAADNEAPNFIHAFAWGTDHRLTATLTNTLVTSVTHAFSGGDDSGGAVVVRHTNTLTYNVASLHQSVEGTPTFEAINPLTGDPKLDADYRLQPGSDAIDAGVDAGIDHDLDGQLRPEGAAPDIGADEFVPVKPVGVSVSGPTEGIVGESYTFVATPIPVTATTPITYTWSLTPTSGQGTDTAIYSWTTPGTKTLTVLLENPIGTVLVPGAHTITIRDYEVCLPLVIRNS